MPKVSTIIIVALVIIIPTAFVTFNLLGTPKILDSFNFFRSNVPPSESSLPEEKIYSISEDEAFVLSNVSKENRSNEEEQKFQATLQKTAVESSDLDVTGCKVDPVVLKIAQNTKLDIINKDARSHTLIIDSRPFEIAANQTSSITADFENGKIYPYACDSGALRGIIWMSE